MNRVVRTGAITIYTCVVLIVAGVFAARLWLQGQMWKSETKRFADAAGRSQAMNLFRKGFHLKYVIDGKRDEDTRLNRTEGAFELIAVFYQPALGPAHKFATEAYVSAFNTQMDVMVEHPDRFLSEPGRNASAKGSQPSGP
jgi:hypothetical protein